MQCTAFFIRALAFDSKELFKYIFSRLIDSKTMSYKQLFDLFLPASELPDLVIRIVETGRTHFNFMIFIM